GLGDYEGHEVLDAAGRYVVPGFIDAHMHLESTKLLPDEFARLVLPLGTTAVVLDPHELANVLGTDGVHWLLDACDGLPLDFYFMASSSIPASQFESPRRPPRAGDLERPLRRKRGTGLAELMRLHGVIVGGDPEGIAENGHINGMVCEAVAAGIAPEDAVVLATHNPATWHRLWHLGAIAPGYQADLLVLPDLERFEPKTVLKAGRPAAEI